MREAARRAGRSEETIRRWIWSGRLPAVKRGTAYRIDVMHLEEVIVEMERDVSRHDSSAALSGHHSVIGLADWLREVEEWKRIVPVTSGPASSELLIEDRRGRR